MAESSATTANAANAPGTALGLHRQASGVENPRRTTLCVSAATTMSTGSYYIGSGSAEPPLTPHHSTNSSNLVSTANQGNHPLGPPPVFEKHASGSATMRGARGSAKPKSKEIFKPSPIIYEHEDGPITKITLKALFGLFETKIAELHPSTDDLNFIDQVMITHLYYTNTSELVKCFTSAMKKGQADNSFDAAKVTQITVRVCNTFKTFLSYFDLSNHSTAVDALLAEVKAAHPGLHGMMHALVTNSIATFSRTKAAAASSSAAPSQVSPVLSTRASVERGAGSSPPPTARFGDSADTSSSSSTSTGDTRASGRSGTPSRRDQRSKHSLATAELTRGVSGNALGSAAPSTNSSGSLLSPNDAIHAPVPQTAGSAHGDLRHPSSTSSINIGTKAPTRARSPPHSPAMSPGSGALSPQNSGFQYSATPAMVSQYSIGAPELPDLEIMATQLALADWNVLSQCNIADFMNASYLPKKKSSAPPKKDAGGAASSGKESADKDSLTASASVGGSVKDSSNAVAGSASSKSDSVASLKGDKSAASSSNLNSASSAAASASSTDVPPHAYNSVARYIEHTNLTTRWIASKILHANSYRMRGKLLAYFVRLMDIMKERQDYTGMMNIFTTLNTNSIWKLRKSWKYVDAKRGKTFGKFETIIKPMSNFAGYREMLALSKPPAVPALAILTKDMVALEEMPTFAMDEDDNPTNYLNWFKFIQISTVLTEQFLRFTRTGYSFEPLPGLIDELMNPASIILQNAATEALPPLAILNLVPNFLLSDEEIAATADRLDMEEQGFSSPPSQPLNAKNSSHSGAHSPPTPGRDRSPTVTSLEATNKVSPLSLYFNGGFSAAANPAFAATFSSSSGRRSSMPAPMASKNSTLTSSAASAAAAAAAASSIAERLDNKGVISLDDSLDRVSSVSMLRRILTQNLFSTHILAESFSEAQKRAFENQAVLHQRDCYIRMLRLLDTCVKYANASIFGTWNAAINAAFNGAAGANTGAGGSSAGAKLLISKPGAPLEKSGSALFTSPLDPSGTKYAGLPDALPAHFEAELFSLELINPHTHLMEVLAETVRLFQKFDGTTKYRNVMKPVQLQSSTGIGQSLLLENRGVLAELTLGTRTLIHAFIAAASHYYSTLAPTPAASVQSLTPNFFFNCVASIDRVGISVQLSIANTEHALPRSLQTMPEPDMNSCGKSFVQKILATLPPALAELLLPFESLIAHTGSSLLWIPKDDPQGSSTTSSNSSTPSKKEKAEKAEKHDKDGDGDDSRTGSSSYQSGSGLSSAQLAVQSAAASHNASGGSALIMSMTLPLGSYASTLTYVSPSQKRYLASKLVALEVSSWKVEHVVTWLYLTGMQHWCLKFEQQSISGAELADLDKTDLEGMGVKPIGTSPAVNRRSSVGVIPTSSSSATAECTSLLRNIKNLLRNDIWDGVVVAESNDASHHMLGTSSSNLHTHREHRSDRSGSLDATHYATSHHQVASPTSSIEDLIIGVSDSSDSESQESGSRSENDSDLLRSRDADSQGSSGRDDFMDHEADDEGSTGGKKRRNGSSSLAKKMKVRGLTSPAGSFFGSSPAPNVGNAGVGSVSPQLSARSGGGGASNYASGPTSPSSASVASTALANTPSVSPPVSGLANSGSFGSVNSSPSSREQALNGTSPPPSFGVFGSDKVPQPTSLSSKRSSSTNKRSSTPRTTAMGVLTPGGGSSGQGLSQTSSNVPKRGSLGLGSTGRGNLTSSMGGANASGIVRMRILEGARSGIIAFSSPSEFHLATFLTKANALFRPVVAYAEDSVYITYFDPDGECVGMSTSQSFDSCSQSIWLELCQEGSLDNVYATITMKQDNEAMNPPSSTSYGGSSSAILGSIRSGSFSSPSPALSGSMSTLPPIHNVPMVIDHDAKYSETTSKKVILVADANGRIEWHSKACTTQLTADALNGRNIDHLMPETMFDILKEIRSGEKSATTLETWVSCDSGAQIASITCTPIASTNPALYECELTFLEADSPNSEPWTKPVDIPKMREAATRSNAAIIAYSQLYGLVQYSNKPALTLLGCDTLQGSKIAAVFPFGAPTLPGDHSLPIQKKDGSLSVALFRLRTYSTTSTDKLIVLSSSKSDR